MKSQSMWLCVAALLACAAMATTAAAAADEDVKVTVATEDAPITEVKVFVDRAKVSREVELELEPGLVEVDIGPFNASIAWQTLRVDVVEGDVVLGRVTTADYKPEEEPEEDEATKARREELTAEITALTKQLHRIRQEHELIHQYARKQLEVSESRGTAKLEDFQAVLGYMVKHDAQYDNQVAELKAATKKLEEELKAMDQKLMDAHSVIHQHGDATTVRLSLDVASKTAVKLVLSYQSEQFQVSWEPSYDVRASLDNGTMELVYYGNVEQQTGEDWKGVSLHLATTQPGAAGEPEIPSPLKARLHHHGGGEMYFDFDDEFQALQMQREYSSRQNAANARKSHDKAAHQRKMQQQAAMWQATQAERGGINNNYQQESASFATTASTIPTSMGTGGMGGFGGGASTSDSSATVDSAGVTGAFEPDASLSASQASFRIPKAATITSGQDKVRVIIATIKLDAQYERFAAPRVSKSGRKRVFNAHMLARLTNTAAIPLLPSDDVSVFFDGNYAAQTTMKRVNPGLAFKLFLGIDNAVRVFHEGPTTTRFKGGTSFGGIVTRQERQEVRYSTKVYNDNNKPVHFTLRQALPASDHEDVNVDRIHPARLAKHAGMATLNGTAVTCTEAEVASKTCLCLDTDECFQQGARMSQDGHFVVWHLALEPESSIVLPYEYHLSWPTGKHVQVAPQ